MHSNMKDLVQILDGVVLERSPYRWSTLVLLAIAGYLAYTLQQCLQEYQVGNL